MPTPINDLGPSIADTLAVRAAPVGGQDVVRKQDLDSSLTYFATAEQVAVLQSDMAIPDVVITPDQSLVVTNPTVNNFGIRMNLVPSGGLKLITGSSSNGVEVDFGAGAGQVADGSDMATVLAVAHVPASGDSTAQTTTTTVNGSQQIKTEVVLVPGGGLAASSSGLSVQMNLVAAQVEAIIGYASSSSGGLMTSAQVQELGVLTAQGAPTYANTNSVLLSNSSGPAEANVIPGTGITIGSIAATGNSITGLFNNELIWFGLSLTPLNWPVAWANNVYWATSLVGGAVVFSIYADAGGSTLLASGSLSEAVINAAGSPQLLTIRDLSSNVIAQILINTETTYPASSMQQIVLNPLGVCADFTLVAQKSTTDNHELRLDSLQSEASSASVSLSELQSTVGTLGANVLSGSQVNDFTNLSILLEKWAYAHQFVSTLRLESPNIGALGGGSYPSPVAVPARPLKVAGLSGDTFTVDFQVLAVCKTKDIWPGTVTGSGSVVAGTGGRAVKNGTPFTITASSLTENPPAGIQATIEAALGSTNQWAAPGVSDAYGTGDQISLNNGDTFLLTISDDGTGSPQNYYLNASLTDAEANGGAVLLNYQLKGVAIKAGATVTLAFASTSSNIAHNLVVPGVPPYPESFAGYFMQVDAYQVENQNSIIDLESGGTAYGVAVPGKSIRKDLLAIYGGSENGYPALNLSSESPGWNGPDANDPNGTALTTGNGLASTQNQPAVALARDLSRLALIMGGKSNGVIWDILVNGYDIWVAGSFDQWDGVPCAGLVRLDRYGRIAWDYNNARAGFTEPVRWLSKTADGNILAASLFSSMYQGQRSSPVHKILRDGTEDTTFNCPEQLALNDAAHQNLVIGVAGLTDGRVAVLCPETLTTLDHLGNILSQVDSSGTEMFLALNSVTESPPQLLLSSHAYSAAGYAQQYNGLANPKGLKLLTESGASFGLDPTWALAGASPAPPSVPPPGAGTGAQSTVGRAIVGPGNAFIIAGNGLLQFNAVDTSWNCQILGNLLVYSEDMSQGGSWIQTGTILVSEADGGLSGVPGSSSYSDIENTGGAGTQAYLAQAVPVATQVNCVLTFYVDKWPAATAIPVIQMAFSANADGTGGTPIVAYAWFDTHLGTFQLQNVEGAGNPQFSMTLMPDGMHWKVAFELFNNSTNDNYLTVTLFPAYTNVLGGTSESVTGTVIVHAPSVEYDYWTQQYVPTESSSSPAQSSISNSPRFQGLYKVEGPGATNSGAADPNFNCVMSFGDVGLAIPFCLDGYGNIYCGGPITSIQDASSSTVDVTQWMLYKLDQNGRFLKAFQLFDDAVTSCRLHPDGYLIVGGKFTYYGGVRVGRFAIIDPVDGHLYRDIDDFIGPVIASSSQPDVTQYPAATRSAWLDLATVPPGLQVWDTLSSSWVDQAVGGYPQLPPVTISDSPAVPPGLWTPSSSGSGDSAPNLTITLTEATAGSTIWYTTDGGDPTNQLGSRAQYTGTFVISTATVIKAYATQAGYANSLVTTATYGEQVYAPTITPPSQNLVFPVTVTISGQVGSTIKYTTDGTDPATSGTATVYSTPFSVGTLGQTAPVTITAVAEKAGWFNSPEVVTQYGDNILPALGVTPAGGAAVPVTVTFALPSTFIGSYSVVYCTSTTGLAPNPITNPSAATTAPGPLVLNLTAGTSISAYATAPGWTPNATPVSASYGLTLNAPTIVQNASVPSLALITGQAGTTINYTLTNTVTGVTSQVYSGPSPLPVSLADLPQTTITAYASLAGWATSPTAQLTAGPFYISGLINVNFTPNQQKVGRSAIYINPFTDVWNAVGASLASPTALVENFLGSGAAGPASGSLRICTPGARTAPIGGTPMLSAQFQTIPYVGDNAYRNALKVTSIKGNLQSFKSIAYGLGTFIAITEQGQIFSSPDGANWTLVMDGLNYLARVKFLTTAANAEGWGRGNGVPNQFSGFIVLGDSTSLVSTDGKTFTQMTGHPAGIILYDADLGSITQGAGSTLLLSIFAVGSAGTVLVSPAQQNLLGVGWKWPGVPLSFVGAGFIPANNTGADYRTISVYSNMFTFNPAVVGWMFLLLGDGGIGKISENYNGSNILGAWNSYSTADVAKCVTNGAFFVAVTHGQNGACAVFYIPNIVVNYDYTSGASIVTQTVANASLPAGVTTLDDIVPYGSSQFVAVGGTHVLLGTISGTSLTWVDISPSGNTANLKSVTIDSGNRIVVVGTGGVIASTNSGGSWATLASNPNFTNELLLGEFTELVAGAYDLLIYGHGQSSSYYSSVDYYADGQLAGGGITTSSSTFDNTNWTPGRQYVEANPLQTSEGEIAFGLDASSSTPEYLVEIVTGQEYGLSSSSPSYITPTFAGDFFNSLAFIGIWPPGWPTTVYWGWVNSTQIMSFYTTDTGGGLLATTAVASNPGQILNLSSALIGTINLEGGFGFDNGPNSSNAITVTNSGGFTPLGATATSVGYQMNLVNPGVSTGFDLITPDAVGSSSYYAGPLPTGATLQRSVTRQYLKETLGGGGIGWINSIQLNRLSATGSQLSNLIILPESFDSLPILVDANGNAGVGFLAGQADQNLGIGPALKFFYSLTSVTYATFLTYVASGASVAGISADPTPISGIAYGGLGTLSIPNDPNGILVRVVATLPGRATSNVAYAYYWPQDDSESPQE